MIHFLKQLIGAVAAPLVLAILIALVGLLVRLRGRRRAATWLLAAAAAVGYAGACEWFGDVLLAPLELRYPPMGASSSIDAVRYIVVLGSGYAPRDHIPVTAALDREGLARVVEGVRIARRIGSARLVVSGGAPPGRIPSALGYARLANALGIDERAIVILDRSLDTADEADAVAHLLGSAPFILVTSASHMPRAMMLMRRRDTHPIPAPTGQLAGTLPLSSIQAWLPTSVGLHETETALHEYLGLAALALGAE